MNEAMHRELAARALGREKSCLVLKNARVIDVFTGEILERDVAVHDGVIVGLGDYAGEIETDLAGRFLCPGFIDAHLHLESTLATPVELIHAAMRHGTTTFIVDPHEVANVAGEAGIDYIIDQTENLPATVFIMLPSCVPASENEDNGCRFTAERMRPYLSHPRVLGLGEVMDYTAVAEADGEMLAKLALFDGRILDGHAPGLDDRRLAAYALAGIRTDHECIDFDYALKEARNGMQVLIREGSGARNVEAIVRGLAASGVDTRPFSFCTDDKHIDDIEAEGHISHNIRKSIALGISPIRAVQMATINTALCYRLPRLGAIAPGYRADLVVLDDLEAVGIHSVYCNGEPVSARPAARPIPCPERLKDTIRVAEVDAAALALPLADANADVIEVIPGQIVTNRLKARVPLRDGFFRPDREFNKVAVVERHRATGRLGVAPVRGFGLEGGAIGTSVSHDSHNIVLLGDNDRDILLALEELKRMRGGYVVVRDGAVAGALPLPIMGLMTEADNATVTRTLRAMLRTAHDMGIPENLEPFMTLSFIALPVLPALRITTRGLFDVEGRRFIGR